MENDSPLIEESNSHEKTVSYRGRFLYSRFNPKKAILESLQRLNILPDTLVMVFSPCLFYGWELICRKEGLFLLCVEAEPALRKLAEKTIREHNLQTSLLPAEYCNARGINAVISSLTSRNAPSVKGIKLPPPGSVKRVARIDFSGGTFFNRDFYDNFYFIMQNAISQFWKNRLTLTRLGRLYCKNIFKNLPAAAQGIPFCRLKGKVEKPILVLGAGESIEKLIRKKPDAYIICVDAALPALLDSKIIPDAVVACESQIAIEKAYIGARSGLNTDRCNGENKAKTTLLFCDLTSRPAVPRITGLKTCFFYSEFDRNKFSARLVRSGITGPVFPPLGSVGLTATYIALLLRKSEDIPVYVSGLDFSYSLGKSHAKGTPQSKALLFQSDRLHPAGNYGAAFGPGAEPLRKDRSITEKEANVPWFTTKNLSGYASLFRSYFYGVKNLFNAGKSGLDLGIERVNAKEVARQKGPSACEYGVLREDFSPADHIDSEKAVNDFIADERNDLQILADILTKGEDSPLREKTMTLSQQITDILDCREYLYLHFPDGAEPSLKQDFLNRVRTQTDFFLKDLTPRRHHP